MFRKLGGEIVHPRCRPPFGRARERCRIVTLFALRKQLEGSPHQLVLSNPEPPDRSLLELPGRDLDEIERERRAGDIDRFLL